MRSKGRKWNALPKLAQRGNGIDGSRIKVSQRWAFSSTSQSFYSLDKSFELCFHKQQKAPIAHSIDPGKIGEDQAQRPTQAQPIRFASLA